MKSFGKIIGIKMYLHNGMYTSHYLVIYENARRWYRMRGGMHRKHLNIMMNPSGYERIESKQGRHIGDYYKA